MPTTETGRTPSFWRCARCNTPNPWASYLTCCLGCGAPRAEAASETKAQAKPVGKTARLRFASPWLLGTVAGYGLILLVLYTLERLIGDAWWPGLVILLSPRWVWLAPILPLAIWAWRAKRWRIAGVVAVEALFILGPIMGFAIPWGRWAAKVEGPTIRIMTLNRGGGVIDVGRFSRYLDRQRIDVVCFQEIGNSKTEDIDPALAAELAAKGWHRNSSRSIASRFPIVAELERSSEHNDDRQRYTGTVFQARLAGPEGREFIVASLHMPTLRPGFRGLLRGDIAAFRLQVDWWNGELERMAAFLTKSGGPILIGGDFNNCAEATAIAGLQRERIFQSAFEEAGLGWGYTRPATLPWVRIDHILASLDWTIVRSWIGPDFGSDHRSLIAEVALPAARPAGP